MAAHRVFVSYSSEDRELFDAFRVHLAPTVRSGLLELWTDQELLAGDDWDARIRDAMRRADAAVVMVSPDMWASDYVVEQEVPELMEAHEAGRLRLLPLFLRPSDAATYAFPVVDPATGRTGIPITCYQGLNDPRAPVSTASDRDTALHECARRLQETLDALPPPWSRRRRRPEGREVHVELRLDGSRLERRFLDPPYGAVHVSSDPMDMPDLQDETRLGERLFKTLFGAGEAWREALRKCLGEDLPSPVLHGVRVRLATAEPGLRALPWARCRWRRYDLAERGWTFELAAEDDGRHPVLRLHTPCSVVMATAEVEGMPELLSSIHQDTFKSLVDQVWKTPARKSFLDYATTPEELRLALRAEPRLLYVYAHARPRGGDFELLLRDAGRPAAIAWSTVAAALGKRPPQAVVLHTVGEVPPAAPLPGVPLLLHLRRRAPSWDGRSDAQIWWEDVLGRGVDPVHALHDLDAERRRQDVIWTAYETWQTRHSDYTPKTDRPRARLDRRAQREAIWNVVRELVQSRERRVTCVVAYAGAGNLVDHFAEQAVDTLKDWAKDMARIHYRALRFPGSRDGIGERELSDALRENLDLQPGQKLAAALKPRRGAGQAKPVWFFDWGTYGPGHRPALSSDHLVAWLDLACGALARDCPPQARILGYLALAVDPERHGELREWLEELRRDPDYRQPHFDLVHLPALDQVSANDLVRFLEDEDNSSCPREYLADLPDRIVLATGGEFEKTVELLEKAERGTMWRELFRSLPELPKTRRRRKGFKLE